MSNERITENLIRDKLRALGYMSDSNVTIDEQSSKNETVKKLLRTAGKSGRGGKGSPEFIISTLKAGDFIIIVECKPETRQHESIKRNLPVSFAVDGVLHYAKYLSKEYNVIAIAASGSTESELKISNYIWPKQQDVYKTLTNSDAKAIKDIIGVDDYLNAGTYDPGVQRQRLTDLMAFSRDLHEFMRNHAKLTESEKPLLVSGTLIAFRNEAFRISFDKYKAEDLQNAWLNVIETEIGNADIPNSAKKQDMLQPYTSIAVHPELGKASNRFPRGVLYELIKQLLDHVWPYASIYQDYDVVGRFYGEFLKYTGGDKKALGIVLTPRHITELFADIANLKKDSKVVDPCCGTGGFLISAMNYMIAKTDTEAERSYIKKYGLIGIEQQPNMYALAASNMLLRGDGKANLYQGSCFDSNIFTSVKEHECDAGFINPPYSQTDEESKELVFVKKMLDMLKTGGTGIAIVPMSCAITPNPMRDELLKHHTLEAVMSMPDLLFTPVGTITCIMVFKAHTPHHESNQKTWFGYWKNDGFIKTKQFGRIDQNHQWEAIKARWVDAYRNKDSVPGESVKKNVTSADEWCAEAYMETDYSDVNDDMFIKDLKRYAAFKLTSDLIISENQLDETIG